MNKHQQTNTNERTPNGRAMNVGDNEERGRRINRGGDEQTAGTTNHNTAMMSKAHSAPTNTMAALPHSHIKCETVGPSFFRFSYLLILFY
jgi:hypothetical protein